MTGQPTFLTLLEGFFRLELSPEVGDGSNWEGGINILVHRSSEIRYPIPTSVEMILGSLGSGSTFWRSWRI